MCIRDSICTPQNPDCEKCPIVIDCKAYDKKIQNLIPLKSVRKKRKEKKIDWVLLKTKNKVLLMRNKESGIWQNLWLLPNKDHFTSKNISKLNPIKSNFPSFKHQLSHKDLSISVKIYTIKNKDRLPIDRTSFHWVNISDSVNMGVPKPVKEILNKI